MEPEAQMVLPMEKPLINRLLRVAKTFFLFGALVLISCTNQGSTSARYLTAEKLWTEKKYEASVAEFDRIVKENPGSAIALQSLWRASITRSLFLKDYTEALKGLQSFSEQSAQPNLILEAQKEIGEILYSKTQQHQAAIDHYQKLIESGKYPEDEGIFHYRISRCWVSLGKIKRAISIQEEILQKFKDKDLLLKTKMDLAQNWYTIGDVEKQAYSKAIEYYKQVSNDTKGKDRRRFAEALFGTAIVLEEMDKPEEAIELYKMIENDYHVPNVVKIRIQKINDRLKRKKI
jgi:tetratricopeptide (TPR) repeat protein